MLIADSYVNIIRIWHDRTLPVRAKIRGFVSHVDRSFLTTL